jgi:hypothetical protein
VVKEEMEEPIILWSPIRSVLYESFSFGTIKAIIGLAGIDMTRLAHLEQRTSGGSSKSELLSGVDSQIAKMDKSTLERFIRITTEEILRRKPDLESSFREYLNRLGWSIYEGNLVKLDILDITELIELPSEARPDLIKAASRLRDGDLSGALSSACAAVDSVTTRIYYDKRDLGDPGQASFQEKVAKCIRTAGVIPKLEAELMELGWIEGEIKILSENLLGSLNQAAYVMPTVSSLFCKFPSGLYSQRFS